MDFAHELPVVADVLDDLERDYAVERRLGKLYRGDDGLAEFDIGPCEQFVCGSVLVEGDEPPGMRGHDLDSVSGPGSDFEHVARDAFRGGVIGEQRALEYEVVGRLAGDPFRGVDFGHLPDSFL